jgi:hypothetical protein
VVVETSWVVAGGAALAVAAGAGGVDDEHLPI